VYYEISREEVVLDKRANLACRLNSIKVRNEKSSLTGKNSFCKEAEKFFSLEKETIFCLKTYIKEINLSIWSSHRNKNSPGYSTCNLHMDGKKTFIVSAVYNAE